MYITNSGHTYYSGTEQRHTRAPFLLLVQPTDINVSQLKDFPPRAIIRRVALSQCGHFMMGTARAFGHSIIVSGSFGNNGLPCDVPADVYEHAIEVPADILAAFWKIDDWNGTGADGKAIVRKWALSIS